MSFNNQNGMNVNVRSCKVLTTENEVITIIGTYVKSGVDKVEGNYYLTDDRNPGVSFRCYVVIKNNPYLNSDIVDTIFLTDVRKHAAEMVNMYFDNWDSFKKKGKVSYIMGV